MPLVLILIGASLGPVLGPAVGSDSRSPVGSSPLSSVPALARTVIQDARASMPDDSDAILDRLDSPDLGERNLAQSELGSRWVRALQRRDFLARGAVGDPPAAHVIGDRLVERLAGMGADARRRVAIVLAADDLLLGVAVRLAGAGEPISRRVGEDAMRGQLERWSVSAFDEPDVAVFDIPRQKLDLPKPILDRGGFHVALDPDVGGGVAAFDRLDRLGGGPLPVVLDPGFVERMVRRPSAPVNVERVSGTWTDSLETLCLVHGGAYQLQGFRFTGESRPSDGVRRDAVSPRIAGGSVAAGGAANRGALGRGGSDGAAGAQAGKVPARAWIHVVGRGSTEMAKPGRNVRERGGDAVLTWCLDVGREGNRVRQAAAARALAALDWPAALFWLEQRWMATGDLTALEGLLAAAARGRVVPALQREDVVRSILAAIDADSRELIALETAPPGDSEAGRDAQRALLDAARADRDARLRRLAVGLAGLSPVTFSASTGRAGTPLLSIVLEGFAAAPPSGRWMRLVIAEGLGLTDERATRAARSVLAGEVDARSRRQALRTLLVVQSAESDAPLIVDRPGELFAENRGDARGLGLELGLLGATTRESGAGWVVPLSADRNVLAELIVWGALLAPPTGTGGAGRGAPPAWLVRATLASIRAAEDASFAAGPDPFARAGDVARGDLASAVAAMIDWVEPALKGGDPSGRDRAGLLRAALRAGLAPPSERRAALERSIETLRSRRDDGEAVEVAWLDLACLVGDEAIGTAALGALQQSLIDSLSDRAGGPAGRTMSLVQASERAAWSLEAARKDALSESFQNALRRAATRAKHPLAQRFYQIDWPPRRNVPPRDLERIEPVL